VRFEDYDNKGRRWDQLIGELSENKGLIALLESRLGEFGVRLSDLDGRLEVTIRQNIEQLAANRGGDFKEFTELVEGKLYEIDRQAQKNKGHVDKLRELNSKLMVEIPTQVNKELQLLRNEMSSIESLRVSDVGVLRESFQGLEEVIGTLRTNLDSVRVDLKAVDERTYTAITEMKNVTVNISSTQVDELHASLSTTTDVLRRRLDELELRTDEAFKLGKKTENAILAVVKDHMDSLRVEIDSSGGRWREDILALREHGEGLGRDLGSLRTELRAIAGLHEQNDGLRARLDAVFKIHEEFGGRFARVEDLIDVVRRDYLRDLAALRRDVEVLLSEARGRRDEVDGRVEGVFARLETLEEEMRLTTKDSSIRKILADLAVHAREIDQNKDGLGELLLKLTKVERDLSNMHEVVQMARDDAKDAEGKAKKAAGLVEELDARLVSGEKKLWKDQQRQDGERAALHTEVAESVRRVAAFAVQIKNMSENVQLITGRYSALEDEMRRQAQIDKDLEKRVELVDDRSIKNLEKLVLLEERGQIQVEQASYVEMINSKMVQLEQEKVQNIADFRLDAEKTESSLSVLRDDLRRLLAKVEGHDSSLLTVKDDLSSLDYLKAEVANIWEGQRRQDRDISTLDGRLGKLVAYERDIKELRESLAALLTLQARLNDLRGGHEDHSRRIAEVVRELKRIDVVDEEINNLRIAIRGLDGKGDLEAVHGQHRRLEALLAELRDEMKKRFGDWEGNLEASEGRSRKLVNRVSSDLLEARGLLELLERRIGEVDVRMGNLHLTVDTSEMTAVVDARLLELSKTVEKNRAHVEKLRELNGKLMEEIPAQVNRELGLFRDELSRVDRISDIRVLRENLQAVEGDFGNLRRGMEKLSIDVDRMEQKNYAAITEIQNSTTIISNTQIQEIQQNFLGLESRLNQLDDRTNDMRKDVRRTVVENLTEAVRPVETRLEEVRVAAEEVRVDVGRLATEVQVVRDQEEGVQRAIRSVKVETEEVRDQMREVNRVQGGFVERFERVDGGINEVHSSLDGIVVQIRADLDAATRDWRSGSADVEGRFSTFAARFAAIEESLRDVGSDEVLRRLRADLEVHGREVTEARDGLRAVLAKVNLVEEGLRSHKSQIERNAGESERAIGLIGRWENSLEASIKETRKDQRRQDDETARLRAEVDRMFTVDRDLRAFQENIEMIRSKFGDLEAEIARQAKVDGNLREQIVEVGDVSVRNLEKIVLLEERNQIQMEQASYVETVNSRMVEQEKAQNVADFRLESERNELSINSLRDDLLKLVVRVDGHDVDVGRLRDGLVALEGLSGRVRHLDTIVVRLDEGYGLLDGRLSAEIRDRAQGDSALAIKLEHTENVLNRGITVLSKY